jgi:hypothetical protein
MEAMSKPVRPVGALASILREEAEADPHRPFGGYAGEWAAPQAQTVPPPQPPRPLVIPPADWELEEAERRAREARDSGLAEEELPAKHPPPQRKSA